MIKNKHLSRKAIVRIVLAIIAIDVLLFINASKPNLLSDLIRNQKQQPKSTVSTDDTNNQQNTPENSTDQDPSEYTDNPDGEWVSQAVTEIDLNGIEPVLSQRDSSSLESKLAGLLPDTEKKIPVKGSVSLDSIDISLVEKLTAGSNMHIVKLEAFRGNFVETNKTSYILQLQVPSMGLFKWYFFDDTLQFVSQYQLKNSVSGFSYKPLEIKDIDNNGIHEIQIQSSRKYTDFKSYEGTNYIFKIVDNQIKCVWQDEADSLKIEVYDQNNPPPPDKPNLNQVQYSRTSKITFGGDEYRSAAILNTITIETIRDFTDRTTQDPMAFERHYFDWDPQEMKYVNCLNTTQTSGVHSDPIETNAGNSSN